MADTIQAPATRMTAEEYLALPETVLPMHLVGGYVHRFPCPSVRHQLVLGALSCRLVGWEDAHDKGFVLLGPLDVVFSEADVLQPDMLYFADRARIRSLTAPLCVAPDLVVEVVSPMTMDFDLSTKLPIYARGGVPHCWCLDEEEQVLEAMRLDGHAYETAARLTADDTFEPELFLGLSIVLDDLWP